MTGPSRRLSASQGVLLFLGMLLAISLSNCIEGMFLNLQSEAIDDMKAQAVRAAPLIDALEHYRAMHGLYPPTLAALPSRTVLFTEFLYDGDVADRVLRSAECQVRWNELHGWIMQSADTYHRRLDDFATKCVVGRHSYTLQSPDFRHEYSFIQRWAFYRSYTKSWVVGWCRHEQTDSPSTTVVDGVCRQ